HRQAALGLTGPTQPLPHLATIQRSFGRHAVDGARAHIGGPAARSSQALGALAYTVGDDIAFSETPDLRTAAHEAAHVIQPRSGIRLGGGIGELGDRYERNADAVANAVVWARTSEAFLDAYARSPTPGLGVQRLTQPIVTPAPKTAISIRDFIKLVEAEEA